MGPVESRSLRNEGKSEAETSDPNSHAGEVIWNSMTQRPGILQADQNSLIMLSLDLPTPTHFTEIRKDRRRWAALAEAPTSGSSVCTPRTLQPTWYLQEVLDEADVLLGLRWQLLEAPCSLGAAAPAGQRLVLHGHSRQNVHVGCDRSPLVWTSKHQFSGPRKNIQTEKKNDKRMETNVDLHPMLLSYIFPPLS